MFSSQTYEKSRNICVLCKRKHHLSKFKIYNGTPAIFGHCLETTSGKNGFAGQKCSYFINYIKPMRCTLVSALQLLKSQQLKSIRADANSSCHEEFVNLHKHRFLHRPLEGCGVNTALGWSSTHLLLPPTLN